MDGLPAEADVEIEVVYDTICPWCFVGKRRLSAALALRPNLRPAIRWRPFLLNPGMPAEGMDRQAYLLGKFGTAERAERVLAGASEVGRSEGIPFAFEHIARTANSVDSHRLVRFAAGAGLADRTLERLFEAYFLEGVDIGRREELVTIGSTAGLERETLRDYLDAAADTEWVHLENARAHRRGIGGVPCFVIGGRFAVSGAQHPSVLARVLDAATAT